MSFIFGLDLGQAADYTALVIVEAVREQPGIAYHVRHLERPPLGTPYPAIVARVRALLGTPPLTPHTPLVLDKTGVGAPVADLFATGGLYPWKITITGGDTSSHTGRDWRVPKREIVSVLVTLFQTGRLKIAAGLPEAATLMSELANFRVKINIATGNESFESWRERDHDDIVLALGLAVWYAERGPHPSRGGAVAGTRAGSAFWADPALRGLRGR